MGYKMKMEQQPAADATGESALGEPRSVSRVALLGRDFRGVSFEMLCQQGDAVRVGDALMRDARRPQIRFTAPVAGRVVKVERGARRRLLSLQIEVDTTLGSTSYTPPLTSDKASLREFMLDSGAWTTLRTRPFGNIPDPDGEPAGIFVTAIDSDPQAPGPAPIIDIFSDEFRAGVDALAGISDAPLYVCHASGNAPEVSESAGLSCVPFAQGISSGLPGVHINALCPIGFAGGEVWHIGYQDVISLGHLMLGGRAWMERVITIGGDAVRRPRSLRVPPGAAISELLADELHDGAVRILSGSVVRGLVASESEAYLGSGHRQISALSETASNASNKQQTSPGVMIPGDQLESLAPPGIYPVPMMRALQVGDVDRARDLGALELIEEDLALLSHACLSQCDYGQLLRNVLDQLEQVR